MSETRYVLCRPMGGLNDTLCQVEICRAYARKYGRILLVDGQFSGVLGEFGDYFWMEGDDHVFNMTDPAVPDIDTLGCYPAQVQGRLGSLQTRYVPAFGSLGRVDTVTDVQLCFPMDRDHPEPLLLHQQGGGGVNSFKLIDRLTLDPSLAQQARDSIARLPETYSALHVRNTDYRTDLGMVVNAIRDSVAGQDLLLCSDDPSALKVMQVGLPATRVHQITTPHFGGNRSQHWFGNTSDRALRHQIAAGSLFDLCALAAADTLYLPFLQATAAGGQLVPFTKDYLSGFSRLAAYLCEDKDRLRRLLGPAGVGLKSQSQAGRIRMIKTL